MKPVPDKNPKASGEKRRTKSGISIRGDVTNTTVINGSGNNVQIKKHVRTGDLKIENVDRSIKVGDISNSTGVAIGAGAQAQVTQVANPDPAQIAEAFVSILQTLQKIPDGPDKIMARTAVQGLQEEAAKGTEAGEETVAGWFEALAKIAPDIWEVAIRTFMNPVDGIGAVFQKVARQAKENHQDAS